MSSLSTRTSFASSWGVSGVQHGAWAVVPVSPPHVRESPSLHPRGVADRTPALCPAGAQRRWSGQRQSWLCGRAVSESAGALDWPSGRVRVGSAARAHSWGWRRKLQQTSVQGGVRSSGAVVAELANAAQGEFQRKRWLVRCWTSDRVLCILLVALSGSLTGV